MNTPFASSNNITTLAVPVSGAFTHEGSGTVAEVDVFRSEVDNIFNGTITTGIAYDVHVATNSGGGTITNLIGVNVQSQTVGANNWAIKTGLGKVELGDILQLDGTTFASLGTPTNGTQQYCSDCKPTSSLDDTCANSGSGSQAFRLNGAWKCVQ